MSSPLYGNAILLCQLHNGPGVPDILRIRQGGAVVHDGGEAAFQAGLGHGVVGAVVQVDTDGNAGLFRQVQRQSADFIGGEVAEPLFPDLDDERGPLGLRRPDQGVDHFIAVGIECGNRVVIFSCPRKKLGGCYKCHKNLQSVK